MSPVEIPQQPQSQASLTEQLNEMYRAAIRLGLYDAADYLARNPPGTAKGVAAALSESRESEDRP